MAALQREVDGEAAARNKAAPQFATLPYDRQRALAERRRYWFGQFGIGHWHWKRRVWNLWRVTETLLPEGVKQ